MEYRKLNIAAIIAYITWIGWIIALIIRDPSDDFASHHLNQAIVINVLSIVAGILKIIPMVGDLAFWLVGLALSVLTIIGIVRAATWSTKPLPLIGDIRII